MHPRRQRDSRLILGKLACGEILEFVTWGRHNVPGGLRANRTLLPVAPTGVAMPPRTAGFGNLDRFELNGRIGLHGAAG